MLCALRYSSCFHIHFRAAIFLLGLGGPCTRTDARALSRGGDLPVSEAAAVTLDWKILLSTMLYGIHFSLAPFWSLENGWPFAWQCYSQKRLNFEVGYS